MKNRRTFYDIIQLNDYDNYTIEITIICDDTLFMMN